jgi:chorismate mutase
MSTELENIRARIISIDDDLVRLIDERVTLARKAGELKRAASLPTLDPAREVAVVTRAAEHARSRNLAEEDIRQIFWLIIGLCRRAQSGES